MGIYVYTLRKNPVKAIDMDTGAPIDIGVTAYAYKESWNSNADYNRMTARMHAAAARARDANPNLVLTTFGDPKNQNFDAHPKMAVFRTSPEMTYFYDTKAPGELVGYLFKNGRKFEFERIAS
jgi:hypothetical protein